MKADRNRAVPLSSPGVHTAMTPETAIRAATSSSDMPRYQVMIFQSIFV